MTDEEKLIGKARLRATASVIIGIRLREAAYPATAFSPMMTRARFVEEAGRAWDDLVASLTKQYELEAAALRVDAAADDAK
jgi:hypothetical protein